MIRRRGKLVKSKRELVVQSSTRFPFDLALRQFLQSKNFDPNVVNSTVLINSFDLTQPEVRIIRDLSKEEANYFNLESYSRQHSVSTIDGLRNALLLDIGQDGHFAFNSRALWELFSHVFKPIDPRTEVILILDRIRNQAEIGQMPSNRDIEIVKENLKI